MGEKEVVLEAVKRNGLALEIAANNLTSDKEVCQSAMA